MSLGGADNDRKVVVFHGVGVFTKDNYKTTTTTAATATTTAGAGAGVVEKEKRPKAVTKPVLASTAATIMKTKTVDAMDTAAGDDGAAAAGGIDDDVNIGGIEGEGKEIGEEEEEVVSSPSKGKTKSSTGAMTVSIGTLTDAW